MRWNQGHESPDLIDRRGQSSGRSGLGGGGLGGGLLALAPMLLRSKGGIVILFILVGVSVVGGMFNRSSAPPDDTQGVTQTTGASTGPDKDRHFAAFVLDDAQKTWQQIFAKNGKTYDNSKLVLYTGETSTACGYGQAATGPFYCPADGRVYIDLSFNDDLASRLGAKGDFAQAYVIAHEVGHHVQNLLGVSAAVRNLKKSEREGASSASVRLELQADCFAGMWAHSTEQRGLLESGDVEEGLGAASAVGDDRLQKQSRGRVSPESFTHGTSEQRARWFRTGLKTGDLAACDTFKASTL